VRNGWSEGHAWGGEWGTRGKGSCIGGQGEGEEIDGVWEGMRR